MADITQTLEWENSTVRLVRLDGLRRHPRWPRGQGKSGFFEITRRRIEAVICHQTAGPFRDGVAAAEGIARFATADPILARGQDGQVIYRTAKDGRKIPKRLGGGRGWPGCPYTFVVPYRPAVEDGHLVVYRIWNDTWHTWHTGRGWNSRAVAVAWAGSFVTRHAPRFSKTARSPEGTAMEAGATLILDYLLPRYGLDPDVGLLGHFDAGKATCPGDDLERWVRRVRGECELVCEGEQAADMKRRPLDTWQDRQQALYDLGYHLGPSGVDGVWGFWTRSATEAYQDDHGLVSDGIWGPQTERSVRRALTEQSTKRVIL